MPPKGGASSLGVKDKPAGLQAGVLPRLDEGLAQVIRRWKLPVLGVNFSYHSQTMLPVVWKKK